MGIKDTSFSKKRTLNLNGNLLSTESSLVMGILNLTPDSYYDGGKYQDAGRIISRVENMLTEGADIIDIGACSSRPGAKECSEEEELSRLLPALDIIREEFPDSNISIDTYRSKVARIAVNDYKVCIINDISAGEMDREMFATIADLSIPYLIMHMKGNPRNMQTNPEYKNIVKEISMYFSEKVSLLKSLGVNDIILDPGFGFGKTLDHNYELLHKLDSFNIFELPICVGISRKSMIYKLLDTDPEGALNGTTALNTISLLKGANILRVHDVKEAKEAIQLVSKTQKSIQ